MGGTAPHEMTDLYAPQGVDVGGVAPHQYKGMTKKRAGP